MSLASARKRFLDVTERGWETAGDFLSHPAERVLRRDQETIQHSNQVVPWIYYRISSCSCSLLFFIAGSGHGRMPPVKSLEKRW
jgi:hypothetical protein